VFAGESIVDIVMRVPAFRVIAAPEVAAVDTTGAGDAHSGVFLAALAGGLSPARAARRANAAAALSVTRPGPATSPTRTELDAWMVAASIVLPAGSCGGRASDRLADC
jgi:sugar/nucleoside kinase (ribokinase family)